MSKRTKEEKLVDQLEAKIRELKQENRTLHKRLSRITKGYKAYLDKEDLTEEAVVSKKEEKKICYECGTGEYRLIIIGNRRFRRCVDCGKTGKVTIIE
jgi:SMC interacting uncharacterized protein involved in chromosome segregation